MADDAQDRVSSYRNVSIKTRQSAVVFKSAGVRGKQQSEGKTRQNKKLR